MMRGFMPVALTCMLLYCLAFACSSKKLIFVQNMFRHGARYPIFLNPDDGTSTNESIVENAGELTPQGKNMHYVLGKALYTKYWETLFGDDPYCSENYCHKNIYARSTNVNRTIESVQSQLRGWFENLKSLSLNETQKEFSLPVFQNLDSLTDLDYMENQTWKVFNQLPKYQSVPIHVGSGGQHAASANPFNQGDFLIKFSELNCPNMKQWVQESYQTQEAQRIMQLPKVKEALAALQQQFPNQKITLASSYKYIDNYICLKYLNMPYKAIFQSQQYGSILEYMKVVAVFLNLFHLPKMYETTSSHLFEHTLNNFNKTIDGTGPSLVLYSAHDTTMAMALATLNLTNVKCISEYYLDGVENSDICLWAYPSFASTLIYEVYEEVNGTRSFQILYNGEVRKIPFCNWQYSCSLNRFYQWYEGWKVKDPNSACGIVDEFETELEDELVNRNKLYAAIIILFIGVILLGIYIWWLKKKMSEGQIIMEKNDTPKNSKKGYIENFEEKEMDNQS